MEERTWENFKDLSLEEKTRTYFKDKEEGVNSNFYQGRLILVDIYKHAEEKGYVEKLNAGPKSKGSYILTEKGLEFILKK